MALREIRQRAHTFLKPAPTPAAGFGFVADGSPAIPPAPFSQFDPEQEREVARLVSLLGAVAERRGGDDGLQDALAVAEAAVRSHGESMARHAVMNFATHDAVGRALVVPTFFERFPELARVLGGPGLTASTGDESALDWWREDPFFNEHHEHWHIVYSPSGIERRLKDRHGELFLYMHQQMLARYDTERLGAGFSPVVPLERLEEPIPEGYAPTELAHPYVPRPPGQRILSMGPYTPAVLQGWRDRILEGVAQGHLRSERGGQSGRVPLDRPEHIDRLGNTIEANIGSPSAVGGRPDRGYYGDLHNYGHGLIANSPLPASPPRGRPWQGVMGYPWTSAMDPVFWRWHRMIDDIGATFQDGLERRDFGDAPAGVSVRDIDLIVCRADQVPGYDAHDFSSLGQWAQQTFGGDHWDEDFTEGSVSTTSLRTYVSTQSIEVTSSNAFLDVSYGDHEDYAHVIRVHNQGPDRRVTVRLWLCREDRVQDRRWWIEMDTFEAQLAGDSRTALYRSARQSSVVRKQGGLAPRPPVLETPAGDFERDRFDNDYCQCGWPYTLLLPRGSAAGEAFRLMVMISENDIDMQGHQPTCGSVTLCGASGLDYPDKRPMGYPFDARWGVQRTIPEWIDHYPFMASRALTIRHE